MVLVRSAIAANLGHTTTLPCWVNPPQSVEDLEVRWYRGSHFDSPIILYREKMGVYESPDASYVGRVSFGSKDAESGGLATGDVSLKLANVTLEDAGVYTCYVSSDQDHDHASVSLLVTGKCCENTQKKVANLYTKCFSPSSSTPLARNGKPSASVASVERR